MKTKFTLGGFGDDLFSGIVNVVGMVPGLGTVAAVAAKGIKMGVDAATGHDPNAHAADPKDAEIAKLHRGLDADNAQNLELQKKLNAETKKYNVEVKKYNELARHEKIEKRVMFGMGAVILVGGVVAIAKLAGRRHHA